MTITRTTWLIPFGVIGFAVAMYGGIDSYRNPAKAEEAAPGNDIETGTIRFTFPDHQGRALACTIVGALIPLVCLILSLSE